MLRPYWACTIGRWCGRVNPLGFQIGAYVSFDDGLFWAGGFQHCPGDAMFLRQSPGAGRNKDALPAFWPASVSPSLPGGWLAPGRLACGFRAGCGRYLLQDLFLCGDNRNHREYLHLVARRCPYAAQHAGGRGLDVEGGLVGLNGKEHLALGHCLALFFVPGNQRNGVHGLSQGRDQYLSSHSVLSP